MIEGSGGECRNGKGFFLFLLGVLFWEDFLSFFFLMLEGWWWSRGGSWDDDDVDEGEGGVYLDVVVQEEEKEESGCSQPNTIPSMMPLP